MPHLHLGLAQSAVIFGVVLLIGTLWHVAAMLLASQDGVLAKVGGAMAFMY